MTTTARAPDRATPPRDEEVQRRRREQLIEATVDSIARHGLAGTTLARVAEAAGLSAPAVSFHFQSKDALLVATLEHVAAVFERRWRDALESAGQGSRARDRLGALLDSAFDPMAFDTRVPAVWGAFWGEARWRRDYLDACGDRDAAYDEAILALTREIVREGGYDRVDAESVGRAFCALLDALPEGVMTDSLGFDLDRARRTCLAFLASVFPGDFDVPAAEAEPARRAPAPVSPVSRPAATLPGWAYRDEEFFELEKEHLFRRQWLLVGHVNEVPEPGDYLTLDAVDERVGVVRGHDGALNAFHNVCRHRASRVLRGERGRCERVMICPYHGWTYELDGRLRAAPAAESFEGFDFSGCALPKIETDVWMGFVFVRLRPDAGPTVSQVMAPHEAELAPYRLAELRPAGETYWQTLDVNWKAIRDNDSEGYHVPVGHPGLQRLFGDTYRDVALDDGVSRSSCTLRDEPSPVWSERLYQKLLPSTDHLPADRRRAWLYYALFPGLTFGIYPDLVEFYDLWPLSPTRTRIRSRVLALPDARREMRAARWLNRRINDQVFREDLDFCHWTDAGLRSSSYAGGPLSSRECALAQFHDRVREVLPVAARREAPPRGRVAALNAEMAG